MLHNEQGTLQGEQCLRETDIILIIEDDLCNGEFLVELLLEETPFYPIRLTDGFQALKFTQLLKPKLLICDYYLPKMDGITLYDRLHSNRELQDVPALIVSARLEGHEREIKERGLAALSKPFDLEDFFAAIENVMGYDIRMPAHILRGALKEQLI
jgi:CheY-like chemotaxis protein